MQLNGSILPVETLMKPTRTQCMNGMDTISHGGAGLGGAGRGLAGLGVAGLGLAGRGLARHGTARQGTYESHGRKQWHQFPTAWPGKAGHGAAGRGVARPGEARQQRDTRAVNSVNFSTQ